MFKRIEGEVMLKTFKRLKFILKFRKSIPFVRDFFTSGEVPLEKKALGILMVFTYAFFPFDLIPDFLTFFGIIDDVVIAGFVLERMVKMAPAPLKEKYGLLEYR